MARPPALMAEDELAAALARLDGGEATRANAPITLVLDEGFNTLRIRTLEETSGFALESLTVR